LEARELGPDAVDLGAKFRLGIGAQQQVMAVRSYSRVRIPGSGGEVTLFSKIGREVLRREQPPPRAEYTQRTGIIARLLMEAGCREADPLRPGAAPPKHQRVETKPEGCRARAPR
jgi:hypothetical protein